MAESGEKAGRKTGGRSGRGSGGRHGKGADGAARRNGVRDVGALLPAVSGTAFRRFGFSQATVVSRWKEIAGPVYAGLSVPQSLRPGRQGEGGTLTVLVDGAAALQMQHIAPQLMERVNRILGAALVTKLRLVQGFVAAPARSGTPITAARATDGPNLAPPSRAALAGIADSGLRSALEDLAAALREERPLPKVR